MLDEIKPGMQCAEFDALLADAIDQTLGDAQRERFERHKSACADCGKLYAEVASGLEWLQQVEEIEPPRTLVHNILAMTSGTVEAAEAAPKVSLPERLRRRVAAVLAPVRTVFAPVLTARFAMSMGMAFFSITLVLNMAQIRITDLTPHNLTHTFYTSQNKLLKYYENMRLVYEIETRVHDLRNAAGSDSDRQDTKRKHEKSRNQEQNQKSEPEGPRRREYSREVNEYLLANTRQSFELFAGTQMEISAERRREL